MERKKVLKSWIRSSKKEMYKLYIFPFFFIIILPIWFIGKVSSTRSSKSRILVPVNKVLSIVYVDPLARFQPKNDRSEQFRLPFQLIPSS